MVVDSKNHFKVLQNDQFGRYAVATKTLPAGSIVFEEYPFAIGPKSGSPAICLECCSPVDGTSNGPRCNKCDWPMCDDCKLNSKRKLHAAECELFQSRRVKFQNLPTANHICLQLDCITPLRVLLAKEESPEQWANVISIMEHHAEVRKNTESWNTDKVNIVGYLHGPCKLKERFSEDLIQQACGLLEVNAFEAKTAKGHKIRGLFTNAATLAHSCVPTTAHSVLPSEDFKLTMRTTVNVKEGEQLFMTYTYILSGTLARQDLLNKGKFFSCNCERCSDPTELGTNFSSILCRKAGCQGGIIVPDRPLDKTSDWKCQKCKFITPSTAVEQVITTIENEITALQELETSIENIKLCENVLSKYCKILHPNHYLLVNMKENLIDMYGWQLSNQIENDNEIIECLNRKIVLGREVLDVLNVIHPGLNRARGMTIYEIFTSIGAVIKKSPASIVNRDQLIDESRKLLNECLKIFDWEDKTSLEHYLADICRKIATDLQAIQEFDL